MKIPRVGKRIKNLKRAQQIFSVLLKYGFDDIVNALRKDLAIKLGKGLIRKTPSLRREERVRKVFEELGPTFIKLGQILSLRPDIVPLKIADELRKLQDEVPPFSSEEAVKIVEEEMGKEVKEIFSYFSMEPMAAASIAQVHRAKTFSGEEVVVKIKRPNIEKMIALDLDILFHLAKIAEQRIEELKLYNPIQILEEVSSTLQKEINFYNEGRNIDRFRRNFEADSSVYIPKVHWELSGERILTMEFIDGVKCSDLKKIEEKGLDRKKIAYNGAQLILKQVFDHGFFHADPHPGNLYVLEGNVIAPLDFGIVGRLSDEMREALEDILLAVIKKDVNKILRVFYQIGVISDEFDSQRLKADTFEFLDRYYKVPLNQLDVPSIINEMFELTRKHKIRFPADFTLLLKSLATVEGVGRMLNPEFNMIEIALPYGRKIIKKRRSIERQAKFMSALIEDYREMIRNFPSDFVDILRKIKKGEAKVKLEHKNLEKLVSSLERTAKFISIALIIAALMISSSLLVQIKSKILYHFLGMGGFIVAFIFTIFLLFLLLKRNQKGS
ncbi:MAG: AarF/ABC1/UbiB kinase family protein [Candidatus Aminicenantes bacterium]|nr:AarF/ABC1/UbiB kinase family protein [Candidatus Aminicenantes bacterium]